MKARVSTERLEQYILTEDAYTGDGGFADGRYLEKYRREHDIVERIALASYPNFVAPILDAQVDPVFLKEPAMKYENELLDSFIKNADNNGTPLKDIIKEIIKNGNLQGNHFAIMDNFPVSELPKTKKEVIAQRKLPYVFTKGVKDVYEYDTDMFGNLISITFRIGYANIENSDEQEYIFRRYSADQIEYLKGKEDMTSELATIKTVKHLLGRIPIIMFNKKDIAPFPPFYPLARQAKKLYNTSSELSDLQRSQAFSILLIPSTNTGAEQKSGIVIGASKALFFNSENKMAPDYISPNPELMNTSLRYLESVTETLVQSADILGSTAVQRTNRAESGVALSYKFAGKAQNVIKGANDAMRLFNEFVELFGIHIGEELEFSVIVDATLNPQVDEVKVRLETIGQVLQLGISNELNEQLYKDVAKLMAVQNGWEEDTTNLILGSIKDVKIVEPSLTNEETKVPNENKGE